MRAFATDKKYRTLVVARIERAEGEPSVEVKFSLKVEYQGQTAHSIAFVKREGFQVLELKQDDNMKHISS